MLNHQGYRHRIERNLESLVQKEPFYGTLNKVPNIINEVRSRYLVMEAAPPGPEEEDTNETPGPNGKETEAHENGSAQETNGSHSNGSHQVSNGAEPEMPYMFRLNKTEIFTTEVNKERVTEAQPEQNGSHSSGSHQVSNGADSGLAYMFQIDKTEIFLAEVAKDEHTTEAQPEIEEYDLQKILNRQETHDVYCPNCNSCITGRVILKKRKRTVGPATPDEPPKRAHPEEAPVAPAPESVGPESPDVFRCLACFSFFIPTGCTFNIFRIFGGGDQHVDVLPPPVSEGIPRSENCTSWLLSCFQPGDSPSPQQTATEGRHEPNEACPINSPLPKPAGDAAAGATHDLVGHEDVQGPATPTPENGAVSSHALSENVTNIVPDPLQIPLLGDTTTETTVTSGSYVYSHGTVVKSEQSTAESSSSTHQTTTTTITESTTLSKSTLGAPSATGIFKNDDVMEPPKPAGAVAGATEHLPGHEGTIPRGVIPTLPPNPRAVGQPHIAVPVPEDVNPSGPQQGDDWDILKAIVYGGLVESVTSLSVVSAAASSGAKTLDIFILGIANLIGGLPLIFHNIADLRDIQDVSGDNERVGHYWLNLGHRSKSQLHMVMALLSYIVFGLLPPVLYGLSFRESNDRENKMMAVAGASLACIALLALGKAHVSMQKPYFKKLVYYLTIAVSSSGLSYVAGVLITRVLVYYGIVEEGPSAPPAPPGVMMFPRAVGSQTSAWSSF
uniref:Uncharacterized protein n=1 Tax=Avena sativa TaxID=4498 RepID=A0ACD5ZQK0_AVESA